MILIGEPTSVDRLGDTVKIGRRGSVNMWIEVPGVQGHVAYPHRADNPIPPLARVIAALDAVHLDDGTDAFPPSNLEFTSIATPTHAQQRHPRQRHRAAQHPLQQPPQAAPTWCAWSRRSPSAKRRARRSERAISGEAFLTPPGPLYDVVVGGDRGGDGANARAVDQRRDVRRPLPHPALPGGRLRPAQRDHAQGRRMRCGRGHRSAVAHLRARGAQGFRLHVMNSNCRFAIGEAADMSR